MSTRVIFLFGLLFAAIVPPVTIAADDKVKKNKSTGESGYLTIRSEGVKVAVDPKIGGRIASMTLDGREILRTTRDKNHLHWGSTVWVAPQSEWQWPPSAVIDSNPYTVVEANESKIVVRSKVDPKTGLQLTKHVEFNPTAEQKPTVKMTYVLYNRGQVPRKVAIWENTRVVWEGRTRFPPGCKIRLAKPESTIAKIEREKTTTLILDKNQPQAQKVFCIPPASESGFTWNSYQRDDLVFLKSRRLPKKVAPGHAPLEIYLAPDDGFAELENQGAYEEIAPGESTRMTVMWRLWVREPQDQTR